MGKKEINITAKKNKIVSQTVGSVDGSQRNHLAKPTITNTINRTTNHHSILMGVNHQPYVLGTNRYLFTFIIMMTR